MIQMEMINMMQSNTTPTHYLLMKTLKIQLVLFMNLIDPSCGHLKVSGLKKDLLQRGHTNPTPKCTLDMCAHMVAQEVDGPSLQPST